MSRFETGLSRPEGQNGSNPDDFLKSSTEGVEAIDVGGGTALEVGENPENIKVPGEGHDTEPLAEDGSRRLSPSESKKSRAKRKMDGENEPRGILARMPDGTVVDVGGLAGSRSDEVKASDNFSTPPEEPNALATEGPEQVPAENSVDAGIPGTEMNVGEEQSPEDIVAEQEANQKRLAADSDAAEHITNTEAKGFETPGGTILSDLAKEKYENIGLSPETLGEIDAPATQAAPEVGPTSTPAAEENGSAEWETGGSVSHEQLDDILREKLQSVESPSAGAALKTPENPVAPVPTRAVENESAEWETGGGVSQEQLDDILREKLQPVEAPVAKAEEENGSAEWETGGSVSQEQLNDILAEKKAQDKKEARAKLPETVEQLNGFIEKKDRTGERAAMERAADLYEKFTERKLKEDARSRAVEQSQKDGLQILTPEKYKAKHFEAEKSAVEQRKKTGIIEARLNGLPPEEQVKYAKQDGELDYAKFAVDLDAKITIKKAELEKKGITLSTNAFYAMMERGLRPEDIKVRGFWGKLFHGGKDIEIPQLGEMSGPAEGSKETFLKVAEGCEDGFNKSVGKYAEASVDAKILEGQRRWDKKKRGCARDILTETVRGIQTEADAETETMEKNSAAAEEEKENEEGGEEHKRAKDYFERAVPTWTKALVAAEKNKNRRDIVWATAKLEELKTIIAALDGGDVEPAIEWLMGIFKDNKKALETGLVAKFDKKNVPAVAASLASMSSLIAELGGSDELDRYLKRMEKSGKKSTGKKSSKR